MTVGRITPVLAILWMGAASGQEDSPDRAIRRALTVQATEQEKDFLPAIRTAEDFEKAKPHFHEQYLDMLGLWPLPEKTPLKAEVTGTLEQPGVLIEKLHFQSRPGLYVTANLYLPFPTKGPYPAILYSCGHYNGGRDGNKTACQEHGLWFAAHGYVCLVYDTLQLGEIAAVHHGTYRYGRWWWHSAGYTPAGVECWNAIRGIDYLQSRPEVDPSRIGATGISGGGAATFWISAADERIKASAPVSGMSDLTWYVGDDGVDGHCDCMFLYNHDRWHWTTIAALVCPRPLLFVNSDNDRIFPMPANDRIINRLKRLYSKYGESDKVDSIVSVGGHAYRTDIRRAIFEFFNRHFKGDSRRVEDADSGLAPDGKNRIKPAELRVFPEDKDIPPDQKNTKIDESFVPVAHPELPKAEDFEAWRKGLLERVKRTCFPPAGAPFSQARSWTVPEQPGSGGSWLVVLNPEEELQNQPPAWARDLVRNGPGLVLKPRSGWTRKNPPNTIERAHVVLGATVDSERVGEIRAALKGPGPWHLLGHGEAGILAAYAALYEPAVTRVTLVDPPSSHRQGPQFLSVLRIWDIPEALGCLAPRPLRIIGGSAPAFGRTAEIYRLAGAADQLDRK
jgi:dienelactone hydrolase